MATAAAPERLEPSEMECSVCHKYFTRPKILPCTHLLCQHCLVSWLNSHPDACCPLCLSAIVEPQDPQTCRSAQKVADTLLTDVTMLSRDPFTFHANHGYNVVLSNNRRTAERVKSWDNGIVLSSQPMEVSMLYEVVIDQNDPSSGDTVGAGVTTADPAQLTLPAWATLLPTQSSVILYSGYNIAFDTQLSNDFGQKLRALPTGSRVGFYLDAARSLHLVVDGCDQGVVCEDVPQPCYAFFDFHGSYRKCTALPLTPMS